MDVEVISYISVYSIASSVDVKGEDSIIMVAVSSLSSLIFAV